MDKSANLWCRNKLQDFWQCDPPVSDELWERAVQRALPNLELDRSPSNIDELLESVLGEGQFGPDHWTLSPIRRFFYILKPLLPRTFTRLLRQLLQKRYKRDFELGWPIEARYPRFQFAVLKNLLELTGQASIQFRALWPHGKRYAFVLTHDIEKDQGQQFVRRVADLEESLEFRSSFNKLQAPHTTVGIYFQTAH